MDTMNTTTTSFDNTTTFRHIKPHVAALMRLTRNLVSMVEVVEVLASDYIVSHYNDCVARNPRDAFSEAVFSTASIRDMLAAKGSSCDIEQLRLMLSEFIDSERFVETTLAPHRAPAEVTAPEVTAPEGEQEGLSEAEMKADPDAEYPWDEDGLDNAERFLRGCYEADDDIE